MYSPRFRKDKDKIPILTGRDIDEIAEQYAVDYTPDILKVPQPFDIEGFLEQYLDLTLDFHRLSHDGRYPGATIFNVTDRVIVFIPQRNEADYIHADPGTVIIDESLLATNQEHRYRFTVGHECGHWVFHRAHYGYDPDQLSLFDMDSPYIQCREINHNYLNRDHRKWDATRWMEWQADSFAAGILMPVTSIRQLFDTRISSTSYIDIENSVRSVSNIYNVSEQAAYLRLRNLEIIDTPKYDGQYEQLSFL